MKTLLTVIIILITSNCFASIDKQRLIDQRIVLMHKVDDIDNQIKAIEADEATEEDMIKLKYYKEYLEKDNPVPEVYKMEEIK